MRLEVEERSCRMMSKRKSWHSGRVERMRRVVAGALGWCGERQG